MSFEMIDQFTNWYVQETVKYMPLVYFLKQKKTFLQLTKNKKKSAIYGKPRFGDRSVLRKNMYTNIHKYLPRLLSHYFSIFFRSNLNIHCLGSLRKILDVRQNCLFVSNNQNLFHCVTTYACKSK